ncbi:sialic acid-binding Ig-like lectin 14 [Lates japonicus]|uniref:Sialic acid-binding Ig-like lectin 14 n=1 Tax=Lates japonicus TaxID=270547 RepID=A0AAD3R2U8_LATJO|nr:sialic acid-binding Ig-like lectin 14 [Lates japonicus]
MFVLIWVTHLFVRSSNADTGLSQKPTVMVPPLTEGEQTTLTCTAPGLCSGSDPEISWMWRGAGEKDSHITGNITANQGRTSTLTFNPSARHHGTEVTCKLNTTAQRLTCKVSFRGEATTEETALECDLENVEPDFRGRVSLLEPDLSHNNCSIIINDLKESDSGLYQIRVGGTYKGKEDGFTFVSKATVAVPGLSQKPTMMVPPLTEGQQTTLTCTAPGLCSGSDPKITWTWRGAGEKDPHITGNITANQGRTSNLTFNPSAEHHGTEVTCKVSFRGNMTTEETVTLNVSYVKELKISGNTAVKMGGALNLTCSVDSLPASDITWTKSGSDKNLSEKDETEAQKHSGSASLIIHNMSAGDFGQYSCTAKHLNNTLMKTVDVTDAEKPVTIGTTTVRMVPLLTIAIISLIVNVAFIICFVFLWNSRKMVKPNEEDRTYMSLQKTDTSPQYDVIGQPLN